MLSRMVDVMERTPLSPSGFAYAFSGIILIRMALEAFSSPTSKGFPPLDAPTLIHYALFFLTAYLVVALLVGFFAGNYRNAAKVALFGFCIVWLPPLIDLVSTGGYGSTMTYIFEAPLALLGDYLTFFGPLDPLGATLGIRVEIALVLAGVAWYVYRARKSVGRTALSVFAVYTALFALLALPSVLYIFVHVATSFPVTDPLDLFAYLIQGSHIVTNALPQIVLPQTAIVSFEIGFNKAMSLLFIVLIALLGPLLAFKFNPQALIAHVQNARPLRALHYLLLVFFGGAAAFIAYKSSVAFLDMLAFFALLLAWCAAWVAAVCMNDVQDQDIDAVSNTERPLIKNTMNEGDMNNAGIPLTLFALLAAYSAGYYSFIFLIAFSACYFVYSVPPLRLKRIPGLASLLIGFAALFSILGGYFLVSPFKTLADIPGLFLIGVILCYTLAVNVRDLKDIKGDASAGVATIPTIVAKRFGERRAFQMVGALIAIAYLLSPLFLQIPHLWIPAVLGALLSYLSCVATPYKEYRIFMVFFAYLLALLVLIVYA